MMTIETIVVSLKHTNETIAATYDGESKTWKIVGSVYPRHLRMLAEISRLVSESDTSQKG